MEQERYYGSYANVDEALREVERLEKLGYTRDEISIIAKNKDKIDGIEELRRREEEASYTDNVIPGNDGVIRGDINKAEKEVYKDDVTVREDRVKRDDTILRCGLADDANKGLAKEEVYADDVAADTAATGAATGAALGGIGGLLAAAGAIMVPGIGPILAAGPIATALAGAATGGIVGGALGGIVGALVDSGIPEDDAKRLNDRFNEGDIIVYSKPKEGTVDPVERI